LYSDDADLKRVRDNKSERGFEGLKPFATTIA